MRLSVIIFNIRRRLFVALKTPILKRIQHIILDDNLTILRLYLIAKDEGEKNELISVEIAWMSGHEQVAVIRKIKASAADFVTMPPQMLQTLPA